MNRGKNLIVLITVALLLLAGCLAASPTNIDEPYEAEYFYVPHSPIETEADSDEDMFPVSYVAADESDADEPEYETIEFVTLPNGTKVDTRVDDEIVDLVLRHFAAIEAGDAPAFIDTLGGGQDGVSLNHWRSLVFRFFPQWFVENDRNVEDFFNPDLEYAQLPTSLQGTGLRVSKVQQLFDGGDWLPLAIQVTVANDNDFEEIFILGIVSPGWYPYGVAIVGHSPGPDFHIEWYGGDEHNEHSECIDRVIAMQVLQIVDEYLDGAISAQAAYDQIGQIEGWDDMAERIFDAMDNDEWLPFHSYAARLALLRNDALWWRRWLAEELEISAGE